MDTKKELVRYWWEKATRSLDSAEITLVNLDSLDPFGHYLAETGELYQLV